MEITTNFMKKLQNSIHFMRNLAFIWMSRTIVVYRYLAKFGDDDANFCPFPRSVGSLPIMLCMAVSHLMDVIIR